MRKKKTNNDIAYQNKDITSKILAEHFKGKSLKVYGIDLPRIRDAKPTNLPAIEANELRLDNLFEFEDDTLAIIDYESDYLEENKCKYLGYIARVTKRIFLENGCFKRLRIIIIYTSDVERGQTNPMLDLGDIKLKITEAFLSDFDPEKLEQELESEISKGNVNDETVMKLIIFPLTFRIDEAKKKAVGKAIDLAEMISDTPKQIFALTGLYTFTDKIIREEDASRIRRKIKMTKVEQIYTNERIAAVKEAEKRVVKKAKEEAMKDKEESAIAFLRDGVSADKVAKNLKLSKKKVEELKKAI